MEDRKQRLRKMHQLYGLEVSAVAFPARVFGVPSSLLVSLDLISRKPKRAIALGLRPVRLERPKCGDLGDQNA